MEISFDTDTTVYQALRIYRNAMISYCRSRLQPVFGEDLDARIKTLFQKEWDDIERNARVAFETGAIDRRPKDALDHLSVAHTYVLLEKYWEYLSPHEQPLGDEGKKQRSQLTAWVKELTSVRNPIAHAPEESLHLRDALRYVDSAARVLAVLRLPQASDLRTLWTGLVGVVPPDDPASPMVLDTLPSREQITIDFVGREEHLADLWRWLGDDTRRIWALIGDGGKGKTTIAYEFASSARSVLSDFGLQGALWLSAKQRRFIEGETVPTASSDFSDLETMLDWVLISLGWDEEVSAPTDQKLRRCIELLIEFPMLIVADDIDSLDDQNEAAIEFLVQQVPRTGSKALLTSRRRLFGLGGCTTGVEGLSEDEVAELLKRRAPSIGVSEASLTSRTIRQIRNITDGSPLYIEDLLRLAHFYSLEHAINQWSGRAGDGAREYSLRRELEKLSRHAVAVLEVLAYSDIPLSMEECAVIVGLRDDEANVAMGELRHWNLLVRPGLVEAVPRYTCSRNLAKLLRRTIEGTDEEQRIRNGLRGLRGETVMSSRLRGFIQQAVALKKAGHQEDAEAVLRESLVEVPNAGEAHAMLGWLYSRWSPKPRVVDAEEQFKRAEALGSRSRALYAHWADMELRHGEFRQAVEICERAISGTAENDPFIWRVAGVAYTKLGQLLRESMSIDQANDAFARARRALGRSQKLSKTDSDQSQAFGARHSLALASRDDDSASLTLGEWREALPNDPFLNRVARR